MKMHPGSKIKEKKKTGKILMFGAAGVGKSSLLERYETGNYQDVHHSSG